MLNANVSFSSHHFLDSRCHTNDCMLFWKESVNALSCATCGTFRWIEDEKLSDVDEATSAKKELEYQLRFYVTFL